MASAVLSASAAGGAAGGAATTIPHLASYAMAGGAITAVAAWFLMAGVAAPTYDDKTVDAVAGFTDKAKKAIADEAKKVWGGVKKYANDVKDDVTGALSFEDNFNRTKAAFASGDPTAGVRGAVGIATRSGHDVLAAIKGDPADLKNDAWAISDGLGLTHVKADRERIANADLKRFAQWWDEYRTLSAQKGPDWALKDWGVTQLAHTHDATANKALNDAAYKAGLAALDVRRSQLLADPKLPGTPTTNRKEANVAEAKLTAKAAAEAELRKPLSMSSVVNSIVSSDATLRQMAVDAANKSQIFASQDPRLAAYQKSGDINGFLLFEARQVARGRDLSYEALKGEIAYRMEELRWQSSKRATEEAAYDAYVRDQRAKAAAAFSWRK